MTATLFQMSATEAPSTDMVLNSVAYNRWGPPADNSEIAADPDDIARWQSLLLLFSALRAPDARDRFSLLFSSSVADDDGDAAELCATVQELWAYEEASVLRGSNPIGRA